MNPFWIIGGVVSFLIILLSCFRVVRQTQRGLIETFGKYSRFVNPGYCLILPPFQKIVYQDIREMKSATEKQEIITKDNLNATADVVVYFKINSDENSVKASIYNVANVVDQLETLARTTVRNVIGTMLFKEANSERGKINTALAQALASETKNWGVQIVRVEMLDIKAPESVQETMNLIATAESKKIAATDFATALETEADGRKRAAIKEGEGKRQAKILEAEGQAASYKLINDSFTGNSVIARKLDVIENSLRNSSKFIIPEGQPLVNVIDGLLGKGV